MEDVIDLMDSYFLTKDDWDAILELGVGPMAMESVKLEAQTKAAFTRLYNQQSHPLPFMKASSVVAPRKSSKEKPDLEEAIDESESDGDAIVEADADDDEDDAPLDLKKDKYVKAPKKKAIPKNLSARKGGSKGKRKRKDEEIGDEEEDNGVEDEEDSEEDIKPKKGRTPAKGKAIASKTKGKK